MQISTSIFNSGKQSVTCRVFYPNLSDFKSSIKIIPRNCRRLIQCTVEKKSTDNNQQQCLNENFVSRRLQIYQIGIVCGILSTQKSFAATVVETIKGNEDERDVQILSSGVRYSDLKTGTGDIPQTGDTVMLNIIGSLENGTEFINTAEQGAPIVGQLGITNKGIPDGLQDVISSMNAGSRRLAIIPASLGYGSQNTQMPKANIPPNSVLYYDVEMLRCQKLKLGLACCTEEQFPCFKDDPSEKLQQASQQQLQ